VEVEQSGVNVARTRAKLSVVDTTPVLAESTASIELAAEAEKAIAAKPEALEPGAYNEAGRGLEVETPPQEGERGPEALPREGRHNLGHCN
jgi:hypothetical protein